MTQADAARLFDVTRQAWNNWENGDLPGAKHMGKLARWLKIPRKELERLRHEQIHPEFRIDALEERIVALDAKVDQLTADLVTLKRLLRRRA